MRNKVGDLLCNYLNLDGESRSYTIKLNELLRMDKTILSKTNGRFINKDTLMMMIENLYYKIKRDHCA